MEKIIFSYFEQTNSVVPTYYNYGFPIAVFLKAIVSSSFIMKNISKYFERK